MRAPIILLRIGFNLSLIRAKALELPIFFGGFDYFMDTNFSGDMHGDLHLGAQVFKSKFLAPEVSVGFYFGELNPSKGLPPSESSPLRESIGSYSSTVLSLSPKLIFDDEEAALVIIPQYNLGRIKIRGDFMKKHGNMYGLDDKVIIRERHSFFSVATGIQGNFGNLRISTLVYCCTIYF